MIDIEDVSDSEETNASSEGLQKSDDINSGEGQKENEKEKVSSQNTSGDRPEKESSETSKADAGNSPEEGKSEESSRSDGDSPEKEDSDSGSEKEEETKEDESKGKKSFFERKKDKDTEKLKEQIKELKDKTVRQLAEFENFRKRTDKEKSQMFDLGAKDVIEKILPVMDSFERGLASKPDDEASKAFVDGMELIYKQMKKAFDDMGVKPIDAVGKPFDPNLHSAVMTVDDDSLESGTVAEELQKGYTYKDSVVRHSMVKVVS